MTFNSLNISTHYNILVHVGLAVLGHIRGICQNSKSVVQSVDIKREGVRIQKEKQDQVPWLLIRQVCHNLYCKQDETDRLRECVITQEDETKSHMTVNCPLTDIREREREREKERERERERGGGITNMRM